MTCVQRKGCLMSDQLLIFTINIILSFSTSRGGVNKFVGPPTLLAHIQYHRAQTNLCQPREPKSMGFHAEDIFLFEFASYFLYFDLFGLLKELS